MFNHVDIIIGYHAGEDLRASADSDIEVGRLISAKLIPRRFVLTLSARGPFL